MFIIDFDLFMLAFIETAFIVMSYNISNFNFNSIDFITLKADIYFNKQIAITIEVVNYKKCFHNNYYIYFTINFISNIHFLGSLAIIINSMHFKILEVIFYFVHYSNLLENFVNCLYFNYCSKLVKMNFNHY